MIVLFAVINAASLYIIIRNIFVYRARMRMLDRVCDACDANILGDWQWRFEELEATGYWQQLFSVGPIAWPRDPARAER